MTEMSESLVLQALGVAVAGVSLIVDGKCTEASYSNESYDSVSRKPLDRFQNALHNKHIFIFGEVLITNMSLNITIYSTLLINLSFFMHCFFHNTNYHSSESCS